MQYGEAQPGDVVVSPDGKRWDVAESGVPGGSGLNILVMDIEDTNPHRFIRSVRWPEYQTWVREG